eukprot:7547577-Alexandrium_andersonii.AAC.1
MCIRDRDSRASSVAVCEVCRYSNLLLRSSSGEASGPAPSPCAKYADIPIPCCAAPLGSPEGDWAR